MTAIIAHQHLYGSTSLSTSSAGSPSHGTLACSDPAMDPADLAVLERAGEATLSPADAALDLKPVRKTFFRLPSGRFAVGRTQFGDVARGGADSSRYIAHHLIVENDALLSSGGHPFVLLDIADWATSLEHVVRAARPTWIQGPADPEILLSVLEPRRDLLSKLAAAVVTPRDLPLILVGPESVAMDLVRVLFRVLPVTRRMELTFSSYCSGAGSLPDLFSLVMVPRASDLASRKASLRFDLATADLSSRLLPTPYARWLRHELEAGRWERIDTFNRTLEALRTGSGETSLGALTPDRETIAAIWEVAGLETRRLLSGSPRRIAEVLAKATAPRPLADALLAVPPEALLGDQSPADDIVAALSVLKKAASRRTWSRWWDRWKEAPILAPYASSVSRPWWRKLV